MLLGMEEHAATRGRVNGQADGDRKTGVRVWAENIHLTARLEGGIPDPHLHSHILPKIVSSSERHSHRGEHPGDDASGLQTDIWKLPFSPSRFVRRPNPPA